MSSAASISVLIVDDDEVSRQLLRVLLERDGYEVREAKDGREGLLQCKTSAPRIVLTDIVMPDVEGMELIMTLRREHPDIALIAMSGGNTGMGPDYLKMAEKLGADASFPKPLEPQTVLDTVAAVLRAHKAD